MLLLLGDLENKISFCVDYINEPPLYQLKTFFTGAEAIYNKISRKYKGKLIDEDRLRVQQISMKSPLMVDLLGNPYVVGSVFLVLALLFNKLDQIKDRRYFDKQFLQIKDLLTKDEKRRYKDIISQAIRRSLPKESPLDLKK